MNNSKKTYVSAKEASQFLGVCRKTVWEYVHKHEHRDLLISYRVSHKKLLFCKQSLYDFVEACKVC